MYSTPPLGHPVRIQSFVPEPMKLVLLSILCALACLVPPGARALERTNVTFKIFQFPPDKIPRIDGDPSDWDIVPDDYAIGTDQLVDDTGQHPAPDPKTLDVRVKVGWVKGLNR